MQLNTKRFLTIIWVAFLGYLCYLMLHITWQYIPLNFNAAFLTFKEEAIQTKHYQWAFFSHVYTSLFILLIGLIQFIPHLRLKYPLTHKVLGKAYVGLILVIGAPSGLIMAIYANGGWIAQLSFVVQAILWFLFTLLAFFKIKNNDVNAHYSYMLRSMALTCSALSLRLFKWLFVLLFEPLPMDNYRLVSWLGWVFNLLIVELYLRFYRKSP